MRKTLKSLKNTNSQAAKKQILWGRESVWRSGVFIVAVGSSSERWSDDVRMLAASERSRQVASVWTILRHRPDEEASACPDVRHGSSGRQGSSSVWTPNMNRPND
jgi:hypothetical protein